jgi:hypothetical protein
MKRRLLTIGVFLLCTASPVFAQDLRPAIFIPPTGDGFDVYIAAAMTKKNVPATVVTSPDHALLTLKAAQVQVQKESGRMKLVKCVMQSCANTDDKASTSVQLLDRGGIVVWSYAVDGDDGGKKSMAETIAKRLKRDYFRQ